MIYLQIDKHHLVTKLIHIYNWELEIYNIDNVYFAEMILYKLLDGWNVETMHYDNPPPVSWISKTPVENCALAACKWDTWLPIVWHAASFEEIHSQDADHFPVEFNTQGKILYRTQKRILFQGVGDVNWGLENDFPFKLGDLI